MEVSLKEETAVTRWRYIASSYHHHQIVIVTVTGSTSDYITEFNSLRKTMFEHLKLCGNYTYYTGIFCIRKEFTYALCVIPTINTVSVWIRKTNLMSLFVFFISLLIVAQRYEPIHGRTTCQPVLTTSLQPRHIPTRDYNITQSSAPDDGHMVARNMLSNN